MKFIKGLLLALAVNLLITAPGLILAVVLAHGFLGLWAGCTVVLGLTAYSETTTFEHSSWIMSGLVLLFFSAINAGLGVFVNWSPWCVLGVPVINLLLFFASAWRERPSQAR